MIGLLPVQMGGLILARVNLWATVTAASLTVTLGLFLRFTKTGLAMGP